MLSRKLSCSLTVDLRKPPVTNNLSCAMLTVSPRYQPLVLWLSTRPVGVDFGKNKVGRGRAIRCVQIVGLRWTEVMVFFDADKSVHHTCLDAYWLQPENHPRTFRAGSLTHSVVAGWNRVQQTGSFSASNTVRFIPRKTTAIVGSRSTVPVLVSPRIETPGCNREGIAHPTRAARASIDNRGQPLHRRAAAANRGFALHHHDRSHLPSLRMLCGGRLCRMRPRVRHKHSC